VRLVRVAFVVVALVVAPALGLFLSRLAVGEGSDVLAWLSLLVVPALVAAWVGWRTRQPSWMVAAGSFIASGVSFSVLIAVLLWAASTGGLD
jgi:hypothetical protein